MTSTLGKRKRPKPSVERARTGSESASGDDADIQAAFKRAFEAKFKPLKDGRARKTAQIDPATENENTSQDRNEPEWAGLSETDDEDDDEDKHDKYMDSGDAPEVQVIEHASNYSRDRQLDRKEEKAFMSAKPPTANTVPVATLKKRKGGDSDGEGGDEAANLKNDLALQRLLSESHLLEYNGSSGSTQLVGRNRVKALDLRLEAIGAKKGSLTQQQKMGMALRKGITGKARERDDKRRSEARENGIILERATGARTPGFEAKSRAGSDGKRKRVLDVGGPSIGKFRNGMLTLSERDVRSMERGRGGRGGRSGRGGSSIHGTGNRKSKR